MNSAIATRVLAATGAREIASSATIQSLWSGYGEIVRLGLSGGSHSSVMLKHVKLAKSASHPRGWNTSLSHRRKVRSYQVEARWYQDYAQLCDSRCTVPDGLAVNVSDDAVLLVMTDMDAAGFNLRKEQASTQDIKACLNWLANFHARFMGSAGTGLWECGTYWHLDTRPDELAALTDTELRTAAPLIDRQLNSCQYQTLVHGDAKLANFCFSADTAKPAVAAVDFQYVGRGCGMKDVAYFIGSCLDEHDAEAAETQLLDEYFSSLRQSLNQNHPDLDAALVETEWRSLYDVAWADFHRFLKGWSPDHWKLNSYSERLTRRVIGRLQS